MNLNELYTQIITENSRSKQNRHPVEGATHSLEGVNPSCGDDITLQLRIADGVIQDAGFRRHPEWWRRRGGVRPAH